MIDLAVVGLISAPQGALGTLTRAAVEDGSDIHIRDTVYRIVLLIGLVAVAWFIVKAQARRVDGRARWIYLRLDPTVQAITMWIRNSPATFFYMFAWTATSIIVQGAPAPLANALDVSNSTNIVGIITQPGRVLMASSLIVADNGFAFMTYVVVYVMITARLEQRLGSARIVIVAVASHVLGSLLTVGAETVLIQADILPKTTVITADVGVSYVMVGTCAGYMFFISRTWRWWYYAALFVGLVLPVLVVRDIWSLGHLMAATIGLITTAIVRRWGVRPDLAWRTLVRSAQPRALPTWS